MIVFHFSPWLYCTLIRGFNFYLLNSPLPPTAVEVNIILLLHWPLMKQSPFWNSFWAYLLQFNIETTLLKSTLLKRVISLCLGLLPRNSLEPPSYWPKAQSSLKEVSLLSYLSSLVSFFCTKKFLLSSWLQVSRYCGRLKERSYTFTFFIVTFEYPFIYTFIFQKLARLLWHLQT